MRTGTILTVSPIDRQRLMALIRDRNAPQKHVWRARIIQLSADGVGTVEIMRQTGKSKTCVWRWQERFAAEGFEGLLRDKTGRAMARQHGGMRGSQSRVREMEEGKDRRLGFCKG